MGADNPRALPRLRRDTQQGMYDAVLHVGEALARVSVKVWGVGGWGVGGGWETWVGGKARTVEGAGARASVVLKGLGMRLAMEMVSVIARLPW